VLAQHRQGIGSIGRLPDVAENAAVAGVLEGSKDHFESGTNNRMIIDDQH